MATWTYEEVIPTPIENTLVERAYADGVHRTYRIQALNGYVLHDNLLDSYLQYDEEGNGIGEPILGFYSGSRTVAASYDFTANPRQFYAVPEEEYNQKMKEREEEET